MSSYDFHSVNIKFYCIIIIVQKNIVKPGGQLSRGNDGAQDKEREDLEMEVDGEDNLVKDINLKKLFRTCFCFITEDKGYIFSK